MKKEKNKNPIQTVRGTKITRFEGPYTFARFLPQSIRQASRHLRTNYHPSYDVEPFKVQQVADAGDITCNPFNIDEAIKQVEEGAYELLQKVGGIISLGGD